MPSMLHQTSFLFGGIDEWAAVKCWTIGNKVKTPMATPQKKDGIPDIDKTKIPKTILRINDKPKIPEIEVWKKAKNVRQGRIPTSI